MSIDGEPHGTLALVMCTSGLVIATIIIAIIAILLRKVNRIEWEKMNTLKNPLTNDIEASPQLESVAVAGTSTQTTVTNSTDSTDSAVESEKIESVRVCEHIENNSHVMERPKIRIFTIFGSNKQSFDLNP